MTTTDTVQQTSSERDPYRAAWRTVLSLMGDELPLPLAVTVYDDGGFTVSFDHLSDGRTWAEAFRLELKHGAERRATDLSRGAITHYQGVHHGALIALFVHEPADLIGVPLVEAAADVEAYVGAPKLPAAAAPDYFREDLETGAPLGTRFACLAEGGE